MLAPRNGAAADGGVEQGEELSFHHGASSQETGFSCP
jgi:hypothetical protein